jgi:hypothetical protein
MPREGAKEMCIGNFEWRKLKERDRFGRPRRRWEHISVGIKEMGPEGVDWIHLAKDR